MCARREDLALSAREEERREVGLPVSVGSRSLVACVCAGMDFDVGTKTETFFVFRLLLKFKGPEARFICLYVCFLVSRLGVFVQELPNITASSS